MKNVSMFLLALVLGLGGYIAGSVEGMHAVNKRDAEWRNAARPIFEARSVPLMADRATPYDLTVVLDGSSVLTRAETYKWETTWQNEYGSKPTKIIVASANQEWVRTK
jgi:hypothetical protein